VAGCRFCISVPVIVTFGASAPQARVRSVAWLRHRPPAWGNALASMRTALNGPGVGNPACPINEKTRESSPMKKQAILLAALIGAASAHAEAQFYGTVAVGASHLNVDCTGASTCDTSDTGARIVGGYDFGNGFSLEAGYLSFGKFRAADSTVAVSV